MIFLSDFTKDERGLRVNFIHSMPFDATNGLGRTVDELKEIGVLIDELPNVVERDGFYACLYYNEETLKARYEYIVIPKTDIEILQEENEALKRSQLEQDEIIMNLVLGGM